MPRANPEERLPKLKEKQARITAEIQRAEARKREAERKRATRRQFLVGSMVLDQVACGALSETVFKAEMDRFLKAARDRALFALPPLDPAEARGGVTRWRERIAAARETAQEEPRRLIEAARARHRQARQEREQEYEPPGPHLLPAHPVPEPSEAERAAVELMKLIDPDGTLKPIAPAESTRPPKMPETGPRRWILTLLFGHPTRILDRAIQALLRWLVVLVVLSAVSLGAVLLVSALLPPPSPSAIPPPILPPPVPSSMGGPS